jgi:hypothetical protein
VRIVRIKTTPSPLSKDCKTSTGWTLRNAKKYIGIGIKVPKNPLPLPKFLLIIAQIMKSIMKKTVSYLEILSKKNDIKNNVVGNKNIRNRFNLLLRKSFPTNKLL